MHDRHPDWFIEELKARNIGTSVHFIPIHLHPYYRDKYGYKPDDFPVAYREYQRMVSLPLYPRMTDWDVEDVAEGGRRKAEGGGRKKEGGKVQCEEWVFEGKTWVPKSGKCHLHPPSS